MGADPSRPASPLLGVVGPTASGKTELALALARRLPAEILVADSRQVYRGMDIGTATPDAEARALVPHHLLDLVDPNEHFTVAEWVARARELVGEIAARGRVPLLVGGTGLYVEALVRGHDYRHQAWSPAIRRRLTVELETDGLEGVVDRLVRLDPDAAARIDLRNSRRVVRALERAEAGGPSAVPSATPYPGHVALVGLRRPREVLFRRIDERARWLFAHGLPEEVARLQAHGFGTELTPMTGHGYREAAAYLAGEMSLAEAVEVTARRTRQYAKRQLSWFRRDPRIAWLEAEDEAGDATRIVDAAERILRGAIS